MKLLFKKDNLLCGLYLFWRRHDHHQAIQKDGSNNDEWEHGMDQDVDSNSTHRTEGGQKPKRIRGREPIWQL